MPVKIIKFFYIIVILELIVITISIIGIFAKRRFSTNVLGAVNIAPLDKDNFIIKKSAGLNYFYEPKPNNTELDQADWLSYQVSYTINSDSLNERFDYNFDKPHRFFRIMTLGDSFTFGHYVNTAENWPERLEDKLNSTDLCSNIDRFEVINLAERGYDIRYNAHRYEIRGNKYNPDLILWFESGSGFERINELIIPLIKKYNQIITEEEKLKYNIIERYYLAYNKAKKDFHYLYSKHQISDYVKLSWQHFLNTRKSINTVIFTFSDISSNNLNLLQNWIRKEPNVYIFNGITNIANKNGILPDGHPSNIGHKLISDDIYNYLIESKFLSCDSISTE
ncbi:hypothetical protein A2154_01225 [Candidatus Gottesmanbacteria bacterium RBG_16_43_7]|uniref:SGNH hydrolase-type esterase domain-containing protein n=1 Tax=Candidatus Gottesmanbacteria bacterium RBG_16_43_7 TaxID=1798373 RepID=A0A1F5Z8A9_9BACT|nr:MAG: hypothetical protein A2154_01225 [Candidatus Gottesmanbacteria bacterium RBG_16_43_7]